MGGGVSEMPWVAAYILAMIGAMLIAIAPAVRTKATRIMMIAIGVVHLTPALLMLWEAV